VNPFDIQPWARGSRRRDDGFGVLNTGQRVLLLVSTLFSGARHQVPTQEELCYGHFSNAIEHLRRDGAYVGTDAAELAVKVNKIANWE
jgi:hypothetical protein